MALTNAFYEAVKSGNVRHVRIMMKNSLLFDPSFKEFHDMEKAAASMVGLYDEHDGKELIEDRSQWNDDYMDRVMVKVLSNFSHERLNHLKEVVRYLIPVPEHEVPEQKPVNRHNSVAGATLGGIGGAAVGGAIAYFSGAAVMGIVGGAAVGGVIGGVVASHIGNGGKR